MDSYKAECQILYTAGRACPYLGEEPIQHAVFFRASVVIHLEDFVNEERLWASSVHIHCPHKKSTYHSATFPSRPECISR